MFIQLLTRWCKRRVQEPIQSSQFVLNGMNVGTKLRDNPSNSSMTRFTEKHIVDLRTALEEKTEDHWKVSRIHPLDTMNVWPLKQLSFWSIKRKKRGGRLIALKHFPHANVSLNSLIVSWWITYCRATLSALWICFVKSLLKARGEGGAWH